MSVTGLPAGGAQFTALEGFTDAKKFVGAAANFQIVNHGGLQDVVRVDQERAAQRNALLFDQDAEHAAHPVIQVTDPRVGALAQVLRPRLVREGAVGAGQNDFHAELFHQP